jgi:hypothetical protein
MLPQPRVVKVVAACSIPDIGGSSVRKHAQRPSVRLATVAAAVMAAAGLSLVSYHAQATEVPAAEAATSIHPPTFDLPPGAPSPGPGFEIQSAYYVKTGTQTYVCTDEGVFSTTSTPGAILKRFFGPGRIKHFAGPRWKARDGSTVLGTVVDRVDQEGTIPWLLLTVTHEASPPHGELNPVTHISRVNTTGGLRPTGTCTPGETRAVPYTADYVFWRASTTDT